MAVSANIIAYTSAAASPKTAQVDSYHDLASLPVASVQLYGDAVDGDDGSPVFTYKWYLLSQPTGSTAAFADDTAKDPILNIGNTIWGNYLCFLVVTNTHNANKTSQGGDPAKPGDWTKAPSCAFVHVRVQEHVTGYLLEKPAQGERKWFGLYRALIACVAYLYPKAVAAYNAILTIATGGDVPSTIGTSNAPGASTTKVAAFDHVHDHGALLGGNRHAVATGSVAGFLSAVDKTKLDAIPQASPAILFFGNASFSGLTDPYMTPGYAAGDAGTAVIGIRVPFAGTLKGLYLHAAVGPTAVSIPVKIDVDHNVGGGAGYTSTSIVATLTAGATEAHDTTHTEPVAAGDEVFVTLPALVGFETITKLRVSLSVIPSV